MGPILAVEASQDSFFLIVINEGLLLVKECCSLFGPDYDNKDFFLLVTWSLLL